MSAPRRIALLLDRSLNFVRGVIRGVRTYAAEKPNWVLRDGPPRLSLIRHVRDWRPHGLIAGLVVPRVARELIRMERPLVDTAFTLPDLGVPAVDVDHTVVGRMAAEYFLERKFRHFGFFGSERAVYSRMREAAFRDRVAQAGYTASSCHIEYLADLTGAALWRKAAQKTRRWLRRLPKPAAILCSEDAPARYLADVCAQMGLRVPEDVALLGAGNDELECTLTRPALSSVAVPSRRVGFEAAALLDRMMAGEPWPAEPLLLPPLHVITRHSTDILAIEDEIVQAALHYIRVHVREPMSVGQIARDIAVSRRLLERRFRKVLGRSVLDEINRVRVERAKELLTETNLPITVVAIEAGFASVRRLDAVFARLTGLSPTSFRRRSRPERTNR
ncbi:MAG TPA: helix-turn-helix domain-containing protein [Planctomycetaceae bacterium]|nr:helix-turn-helix domain-containing protein [Planctomycetaceae bacterium]